MVTEERDDGEFSGLLQRDAGGFLLQCDDGTRYRLELLRTPIDEVEKRVVIIGRIIDSAILEADGIRLA
ncbi:hypothetical protein AZE99_00410 [Sphingorhabdus sp. M41]|nr:hypothetical protein AZE99_00410 [Sphingorhabdus sp. M41]